MKKEYYILQNIANDCDWRIEKASSHKEASNLAIHLGCEVLEGPMSFSEAMERYEELEAENLNVRRFKMKHKYSEFCCCNECYDKRQAIRLERKHKQWIKETSTLCVGCEVVLKKPFNPSYTSLFVSNTYRMTVPQESVWFFVSRFLEDSEVIGLIMVTKHNRKVYLKEVSFLEVVSDIVFVFARAVKRIY